MCLVNLLHYLLGLNICARFGHLPAIAKLSLGVIGGQKQWSGPQRHWHCMPIAAMLLQIRLMGFDVVQLTLNGWRKGSLDNLP